MENIDDLYKAIPGLKDLRWDAQKLIELLDDPHPGLSTWWTALEERIQLIHAHLNK